MKIQITERPRSAKVISAPNKIRKYQVTRFVCGQQAVRFGEAYGGFGLWRWSYERLL